MRSSHIAPRSPRLPNALATIVLGSAVGAAYFNCDPMIAGSEPSARVAALDLQPMLAMPSLPQSPQPAPGEPDGEDGARPYNDAVLTGKWAMQMNVALLERGVEMFKDVEGYSFTMSRQERVGGDLLDPQVMNVKLRHEPFSIYMKWVVGDPGRQVLYVEGANENKLMVQPGGIKGRLTGTLSFALDDPMVTAESRHPLNQAGLLNLARKVLEGQKRELAKSGNGWRCELYDDQHFGERPCYLFVIEYKSKEHSELYRKSMMYIDKELSLPTCIRNFTWGTDVDPAKIDEETLVEAYGYTDIQTSIQLAEEDFSKSNRSYRMR
jgi:hypothetical protein